MGKTYIPEIKINGNTKSALYTATMNKSGSMTNSYSPFKNLQEKNNAQLTNFTTDLLNFDLEHPVDILVQDSYDGSVNLVLNDGKNQPRLIGSRFSAIDNGQFKITDHAGFKDTNIYDEKTFDIDTSLKAIAQKIPQIEYKGLTQFGGTLPCGSYTFYFKLADADGNESEVLAESGMIQVFIGGLVGGKPDPNSMRMGVQDENSGKSVTFKLTNIDSGFDYVHVMYARSSSDNTQASVDTYKKVIFDYPAFNGEADITITGNETALDISAGLLYTNYADLEAVKTQTVVNNVLFFGNTIKKERDWDALRRASWKIIPGYGQKPNVGSISSEYVCNSEGMDEEHYSGVYYNTFNCYYRVGYWPDEIYQFGIVYIFNDNSLSPVFNIQGVDFTTLQQDLTISDLMCSIKNPDGTDSENCSEWEAEPEDYYFNKTYRLNSKGVVKFPSLQTFKQSEGRMRPSPLYVTFDLTYINCTTNQATTNQDEHGLDQFSGKPIKTAEDFFIEHDIKGYFFVRKTRIPTILAQGMAIGLTGKDNGALPIIQNYGKYRTQSFLSQDRLIDSNGTYVTVPKNVTVNAALVPDAELDEATFNQLFVSNSYSLSPQAQYYFGDVKDSNGFLTSIVKSANAVNNSAEGLKRKLTVVQDSVKTLTDGEVYFSTQAGDLADPTITKDVCNIWNHTDPLSLTSSETVVRGNWGPFVGIGNKQNTSDKNLVYGRVYNIKQENYSNGVLDDVVDLEFLRRFNDISAYKAITHRIQFNPGELQIECYRGDCFQSLFTHRMFRNFIDPELPTNDKIINPKCWADNYAVRCTAIQNAQLDYNVYSEDQGWKTTGQNTYANEIVQAFEVKEDKDTLENLGIKWDAESQCWLDDKSIPVTPFLGKDVVYYINKDDSKNRKSTINKISTSEQESTGLGGVLKNIFKSDRWELRGVAAINRADVNAVGLGQWITFPICSSRNLAMRDIDYSNATEQASFNRKRSFYPLAAKDPHNPLRDSNIINQAASITLPHKSYFAMPNVPFIKQEYFTRVINSLRDSAASITNEFKIMLENAYRDYTKIYGSITKLLPLGSNMLIVFEHGIGILSLSETMPAAKGPEEYLPAEVSVVTQDIGSMWKDSVIQTQGYIYGLDTVAKILWRIDSSGKFTNLSQIRVEKFLIDSIDLSEFVRSPYVGRVNVKSHYNAFKHDVMFTYYNDILYQMPNYLVYKDVEGNYSYEYSNSLTELSIVDFDIDVQGYLIDKETRIRLKTIDGGDLTPGTKVVAEYNEITGVVDTYTDKIRQLREADPENGTKVLKWATGKSWSLCFNELIGKFVTFYDWIPLESENIDNIWFSFDREAANKLADQGVRQELLHLKKPDISTTSDLRDETYGKIVMDKAFNTTHAITYIPLNPNSVSSVDNTLTFSGIQLDCNDPTKSDNYQVKDYKYTVLGLYLKGLKDYSDFVYKLKFTFGNPSTNPSVIDYSTDPNDYYEWEHTVSGESWKFLAIVIKASNKYKYAKLEIELINTSSDTTVRYGAISDIIVKTLNMQDNSSFTTKYEQINQKQVTLYNPSATNTIDDFYCIRDLESNLKLWKHGFAGLYDNEDIIRPTYWYGKQHEFNFEFIARKDALHKIFTNLQLVSNKTEPNKFEIEVVGEVYDWHNHKPVLKWIADQIDVPTSHVEYEDRLRDKFVYVLSHTYGYLCNHHVDFPRIFGMQKDEYFAKLPYMRVTDAVIPSLDPQIIGDKSGVKDIPDTNLTPEQQDRGFAHSDNTPTTALVYDSQLNEYRVHTEQLGNNIWKYGRLRGNMQYLEDLWRVEIRPVAFKYSYIKPEVDEDGNYVYADDEKTLIPTEYYNEKEGRDLYIYFTRIQETRPRDKYAKIKIRYSGEDLAVIQSIATIFNYSYA